MRVRVNVKSNKYVYQCGDILVIDGSAFLIIKDGSGYIAKSFDGISGSTGYHETLGKLQEYTEKLNLDVEYYSQIEYDLLLVEKKK